MSAYDDFLDDIYPAVDVAGITFNVSRILYKMDICAYDCGKHDYFDMLVSDFFDDNCEFSRKDILTDGYTSKTAEAWAWEMLENDKEIDFSNLEFTNQAE